MLINYRIKIRLMITLMIISIYASSNHDNLISAPYQNTPDEWWITILKKHKIDITKNHLKQFYSFGSDKFAFNNMLVVGNITIIKDRVWSISESRLFMKMNSEKYFIVKSKSADLDYPNEVFIYYTGTYEEYNFDNNSPVRIDSLEITPVNKFQFRNLVIDLKKDKITAHTKAGTIKVY